MKRWGLRKAGTPIREAGRRGFWVGGDGVRPQTCEGVSPACAFGGLCGTQIPVTRVFQDDLPSVGVSRLRASGAITSEMTRTTIGLADVEVEVGLSLQKFPNGGSWTLFRCPSCGRKARTLRLLEGCVVCWRCCVSRGVRYRCEPMSVRRRAELRIPKLRAKLDSAESLRLKPHLWGKMERRSRLEAALRRAEYVAYRHEFTPLIEKDKDGG